MQLNSTTKPNMEISQLRDMNKALHSGDQLDKSAECNDACDFAADYMVDGKILLHRNKALLLRNARLHFKSKIGAMPVFIRLCTYLETGSCVLTE